MLAHRSPRSSALYILLALGLAATFLYYRPSIPTQVATTLRGDSTGRPANRTLGFGGLYVVSGPGSPRRAHLEEAAAVTEMNLTIPAQVAWTDEDVQRFQSDKESESQVLTGSVKAWLSHHLVLREFLESGLETALFFEDDVDWDIRLRTQQIPLAQQAVQQLSDATVLDAEAYPWGTDADWDLLYVGHCGDYFGNVEDGVGVGHNYPEQLTSIRHVRYEDPTMLPRYDLHPYTANLLDAFNIPQKTRLVHQSKWPLCTFGYAVTRRTAERILTEIAPPYEQPERNIKAYDVAILSGCRDGPLKCYTVTPELFHHMEGESLIADAEASERQIFRPPVDAAGLEQVRYRKETSNIGCGFFDGSFYYSGDENKLGELRGMAWSKECLKQRKPQSV
ncbi:hypothetical protein B0A50_07906 [Salinomyces thailandicus]|uniref:Glycosyltransferase family 25 protein n=1 Tax=Salinomyces thailandicus TaxID=706561 RepID=A0A4U0TLM3_9PEZI|nr:hypothetical protein B0A50_07906 [Salinomyces thailandica]